MIESLDLLEKSIAESFTLLDLPTKSGVPVRSGPNGEALTDVLVVGAGMNGLAAGFALRRLGIFNIRQIDQSQEGYTGPWRTYARMELLRSGKKLTGPALGHSFLTPQAWWHARFPERSWEDFEYFSREEWAEYLDWYASVTHAKVEFETKVTEINPHDDYATVKFVGANGDQHKIFVRQVILANGREGLARPRYPSAFLSFIGDRRVVHSSEVCDFSSMGGKEIAIVGLAASAFDNAATLAEAGAKVTLLGRAPKVPRLNKMKYTVTAGFAEGFPLLSDRKKLEWLRHITETRISPPKHTVKRVAGLGIELVTGIEIDKIEENGTQLKLLANGFSQNFDKVILATGFGIDVGSNDALSGFSDEILLWKDVMPPSVWYDKQEDWRAFPYLSEGFAFKAKKEGRAAAISRIRCFNHAAQLSLGNLANDIPHASFGAERLARSVVSSLFVEDADTHFNGLVEYDDTELQGDEWPGKL